MSPELIVHQIELFWQKFYQYKTFDSRLFGYWRIYHLRPSLYTHKKTPTPMLGTQLMPRGVDEPITVCTPGTYVKMMIKQISRITAYTLIKF